MQNALESSIEEEIQQPLEGVSPYQTRMSIIMDLTSTLCRWNASKSGDSTKKYKFQTVHLWNLKPQPYK